ncbi:lipopolysaccharide biosynthesis protein [Paradesertivirga mongoliensis]|uniref:Lipopolysaccharide biosynthesis protein n=1 Tax=Paradesertivirga mongoliensis TaxID=2100740 RepID=A0ABW4ZIM6_9SPHI|nr:oligosaccharide flippase family protein [Pedobacter mongoliensis]
MLKKFFTFSLGGFTAAAITFASTPIISNLVSPVDFGKSGFIILCYSFMLQVILLGLDQSYVREYYNSPEQSRPVLLKRSAAIPIFISAVLVLPLLYFYKPISNYLVGEERKDVVVLLGALSFAATLERFASLKIRMAQKGVAFSIVKVTNSIVNVAVTIVYAKYVKADLLSILIGCLSGLVVSTIVASCLVTTKRDEVKLGVYPPISIIALIKYGLPFIPAFIVGWLFEAIDRVAIKQLADFSQLGLYTAAMKIVAILTLLQTTFSNFWVPVALEAFEKGTNDAKLLLSRWFQCLSALFFLGGLILMASNRLLIKLFASDYSAAAVIIPFLVFIPLINTLSEITVGGINFMKKTYLHVIISIVCTVVGIALTIPLVSKFGAKGAALSAACSYLVFFSLRTYFSYRLFPVDFNIVKFASGCMVLFVSATANTFYPNDAASTVVNCLSIILICIFNRNDFTYMIEEVKLLTKRNLSDCSPD